MINVKAASSQAHTLAIEMKPLPHSYEVTLTGGPTGYATISTDGVPPLSSAPPKDFDGPGDAWSPEHLLLASVEACFMLTFRAVARGSNFDFLALDLSAHGTVDRKDGVIRFTEIVLKPRLTLPRGPTPSAPIGCSTRARRRASSPRRCPSPFVSRLKFLLRPRRRG